MKILAVSDEVVDFLQSPRLQVYCPDVELILSCGDLPLDYLEFLANTLEVPLYFVFGNHDTPTDQTLPPLCLPLDGRTVALPFGVRKNHPSPFTLLLAGLGGSIRYKPTGSNQYTQQEMFVRAMRLIPGLLHNRHTFGRHLDILITHSPPFHIHDHPDRAHRGLKAFLPILDLFHPQYHLHGHVSGLGGDHERIAKYNEVKIINVNPYRIIEYTPFVAEP